MFGGVVAFLGACYGVTEAGAPPQAYLRRWPVEIGPRGEFIIPDELVPGVEEILAICERDGFYQP